MVATFKLFSKSIMRNINELPTEERDLSEVDMDRRKMLKVLGVLAGLAVAGPLACGQDYIASARRNGDASGDSDNGDSPEGCGGDYTPEGSNPLDGQPCTTPEGSSGWSPDGKCICMPEGCYANDGIIRPPQWECY